MLFRSPTTSRPLLRRAFWPLFLGSMLGAYGFASAPRPAVAQPKPEVWLPIDMSDLIVQAGTPLDFSFLREKGEAGQYGFATINAHGELVFEQRPDEPLRLFCAALPLIDFDYHTPEQLDELARQIARAGYNCVRLHWTDLYLMNQAPGDLAFNPERLDILLRLMADLKREGVYVAMDATSSSVMFHATQSTMGFERGLEMKAATYYDPQAREHWEKGVSLLFNTVNPYTGLALKDDPQIVLVGARNEPTLSFLLRPSNKKRDAIIEGLLPEFRAWLEWNYASPEQLAEAWGQPGLTSFDQVEWPSEDSGAAYTDLLNYFIDTEQDTYAWEADTLRDKVGIRVPVTDYNTGGSLQVLATMDELPMVDTHSYHDHPHGFGAGASMHNRSLIEMGAAMVCILSGRRSLEKPFIVTEWGSPFYNQWRHETGLIIPAYASLQGWQMIAQHAFPVGLEMDAPIRFFRVYRDPPLRAAERMAALLYARGDVRPSENTVEIDLGTPEDIRSSSLLADALSSELTRLALVSRFGNTIRGQGNSAPAADIRPAVVLKPTRGATVTTTIGSEEAVDVPDNQVTAAVLRDLKDEGVLPAGNPSDPAAGVFESDTGQLLLSRTQRYFSVNTPLSQGAALDEEATARLDDVSFVNQGCPVALLASSLDGAPLKTSAHLLLIVASDAHNTDMRFETTPNNWLKVLDFGKLPVIVRAARFQMVMPGADASQYAAWTLRQNGTRADPLKIENSKTGLILNVDMSKLAGGPSTYIEIVRTDIH
jgi:hypothetical protein